MKEFSQLGDQLYMPVQTYSSGMRARLAFGVSLAIDFEMYLVDEITAVGDAKFKQRSKKAFQEKLGSATMVMVSHSMNTLRDYCEAGLVLHEGQLFYYPDLEDAIEHHNQNMGEPNEPRRERPDGANRESRQPLSPAEKEQIAAERIEARRLERQRIAAERRAARKQQRHADKDSSQVPQLVPPPLPASRPDQT